MKNHRLRVLDICAAAIAIALSIESYSTEVLAAGGGVAGALGAGQPPGPADFIFNTVWFFLLGLMVVYMMVLRPQQQKQDQQTKFIESLKRNDEVMTSGGIIGRVYDIKPGCVTVEIAPNVRIRMLPKHVLAPEPSGTGKSVGA